MGADAMRRIAKLIGAALANEQEDDAVKAKLKHEVETLASEFPLYPDWVDVPAGARP